MIGLLLYFIYSFLKTLAIHFKCIFVRKIFFYCKFRRFSLRIFYKILVFWDYWLKLLKVLLTSKCVTGLLLNFRKTLFITFATVSQPFSVKIVICNSQFTHFSTGVNFEKKNYYYFETIIFRLKFLVEVFVCACNLKLRAALLWHLI